METQHYELLYIVPIKFLDDELQKIVANINGLINKLNGTITREDNLGKLRLAYPIKNVHQGSYVVAEFDMSPENEKKLNSQLSLTPEVFFFSSRRRHTRLVSDWSSDVCSSDLMIRHTRLVSDWSSDVCSSD